MTSKVTPGYYKHFKGSLYKVIAVAEHESTGEVLVIYTDSNGHVWARDFGNFLGAVEVPTNIQIAGLQTVFTHLVPRFTRLKGQPNDET